MSTRTDMAECILTNPGGPIEAVLALLAERGMVVLGADGEPLDVRPLMAMSLAEHFGLLKRIKRAEVRAELTDEMRKALTRHGWPDGLYDACLAAAEVEP